MKYPWAQVGQSVVCVIRRDWQTDDTRDIAVPGLPKFGDVLAIAAVEADEEDVWLVFAEYPGEEFSASGFRPAIPEAEDIAMFKAIAESGLAQNGIQTSSPEPVA